MKRWMLLSVFLLALGRVHTALSQNNPVLPLHFIYRVPPDNSGFLGCGGIVGVDVSLQGCATIAPTANEFVWTFEFQPLPALKLGRVELPIVPEISLQRVIPQREYMYFLDSDDQVFAAPSQTSLRLAVGYDSYFYDRHLWGNRTMLKVGGGCLLSRPLDLNPRREGCDALDLDNWFVKGLFARTINVRTEHGDREVGYLQASVYHEVPDHDFASKPDTSGIVVDTFNDDGLDVTFVDVVFLAKTPSFRLSGSRSTIDLRLGGGLGFAHQMETATSLHGDFLGTVTLYHNLAITGGVKYTSRSGSFTGLKEDPKYWTAQAYIQWRPDFVIFWDHRY
jgi:hypothetical protein